MDSIYASFYWSLILDSITGLFLLFTILFTSFSYYRILNFLFIIPVPEIESQSNLIVEKSIHKIYNITPYPAERIGKGSHK